MKKLIIKWSIKQLAKIITSDKDYGDNFDYGVYNIKTDFDDITLNIKKPNKKVDKKNPNKKRISIKSTIIGGKNNKIINNLKIVD